MWLRVAFAVVLVIFGLTSAGAQSRPKRIVSINLCTDQLALMLADRDQIASITFMATDPRGSVMAGEASGIPINHGEAEEVLNFQPDLVLGGTFTSRFTVALLRKLGYRTVILDPASDIASIQENIRIVAKAVGHPSRGETMIRDMNAAVDNLRSMAPVKQPRAIIYRSGGRVAGRPSLGDAAMTLAGFSNLSEELGLGAWGNLSVEGLLRAKPDLLVLDDMRRDAPSQGLMILRHPALTRTEMRFATARLQSHSTICGTPRLVDAARDLLDSYQGSQSHDQ